VEEWRHDPSATAKSLFDMEARIQNVLFNT